MSSSPSAQTESAPSDLALVAEVIPLVPAWRVDHTFDYVVPAELIDALEPGSLVRVPFGGRRVRAVVTTIEARTPDRALETIAGVVTAAPVAPPPMVDVFDWIARRYVTPRGKAFARAVPSRVRVRIDALPPLPQDPSPDLVGSYAGGAEMIAAIEMGDPGIWCFECLPTHDRSRLIAELVAAAGRGGDGTALVCVPEVRYGSRVLDGLDKWMTAPARVDSAQSEADRSRSLLALAAGRGVGAGGRAALLAPARGLRLIVVDEEPHRSYKEDRSPRYDARRLAIHRARLSGAVCVLMGTTLTVESGAAARKGEFGWVTPGRRERRDARPVVEFAERDEGSSLSRLLHGRIKDVLAHGGRTALLAPAGGYSRAVWCVQCRRSLRCDVCEAGMFFDRATGARLNRLRCPRCGATEVPPEACPNCGGTDFRWLGAGSERLAEQLQKAFPRALVIRADPDDLEASTERALRADIYVTTWIGTKASLRPEVSLVGVIDADALIRRPHFHAAEHAFQALTEMAEWAGPAAEGGRLVVQASEPGHYVLQALVRGDYGFFLDREVPLRDELGYPPFSELVRVSARSDGADVALAHASDAIRDAGGKVLGPISVPGPGGPTRQLLVKCPDALEVAGSLRALVQKPEGRALQIDVDPR